MNKNMANKWTLLVHLIDQTGGVKRIAKRSSITHFPFTYIFNIHITTALTSDIYKTLLILLLPRCISLSLASTPRENRPLQILPTIFAASSKNIYMKSNVAENQGYSMDSLKTSTNLFQVSSVYWWWWELLVGAWKVFKTHPLWNQV